MPKLFESIFGGPSKSAQSSATPTGFASLPKFGQEAFKEAVTRGQELSQDPGLFAPAGLTPEQQASLSTLTSGLGPTSPEAFRTGLETFGDPFQEQVIQNAIRDINTAGRGQLSDIGTLASEAGGFGGTRQALLESELQKNLQQTIGDVSGQLRSQGFQQAADRTLGDIARGQQLAIPTFGFGEVGRGVQTQQQQAPLQAVDFLSRLSQGLPTGGGQTSSGVSTGARESILGDVGKLLGGASAAFAVSDERLKQDIECVGRENGYNIYEFAYKSNPESRYRGVMAQEVIQTDPDAVMEVDGYLAVNYGAIGLQMVEV